MQTDYDCDKISRKTWTRNVESINKIGYIDGAADGQAAEFQSSFDKGYQQGFNLGLDLGFTNAISIQHQETILQCKVSDPRRINCQICINGIPPEQHIENIYNTQEQKNLELIKLKHNGN